MLDNLREGNFPGLFFISKTTKYIFGFLVTSRQLIDK